jgi:hypothetical protein
MQPECYTIVATISIEHLIDLLITASMFHFHLLASEFHWSFLRLVLEELVSYSHFTYCSI